MVTMIPGVGSINLAAIGNYVMYGGAILFIIIFFVALNWWLISMSKQTRFIEINLETRKIQELKGRFKKKKSGLRSLYIRKLKKFLPNIQQKDIYTTSKKKDLILLFKDNNGLHHTVRVPTQQELEKWYKAVYDIDINAKNKDGKFIHKEKRLMLEAMYLIPNPSEDLDWLGTQCVEADQEFIDVWWKHPSVMILGTVMLCSITFIVFMIIMKSM